MTCVVIDLSEYRRRRAMGSGGGIYLTDREALEAVERDLRNELDRQKRFDPRARPEVWVQHMLLDFLTERGWELEIRTPLTWFAPVAPPVRSRRPFVAKNPKPKATQSEGERPPRSGWWAKIRLLTPPVAARVP